MLFTSLLFYTGYLWEQGISQLDLFFQEIPIDHIEEVSGLKVFEKERIKEVPKILSFAKTIGLKPGNSYQKYVPLKEEALTYVVEAAYPHKLKWKTHWFPMIGEQPYLGFFKKDSALKFKTQMLEEGYDVSVGSVEAFSLLGFFSDPLYSSMLQKKDQIQFIEVIFHETLHRTLYIPGFPSFNENLADFVAKKATYQYLLEEKPYKVNEFQKKFDFYTNRILKSQEKFKVFLKIAETRLNSFYEKEASLYPNEDDIIKLKSLLKPKKQTFFKRLSEDYKVFMGGIEKGTTYEKAFPENMNNALFLSYQLYENYQKPLENLFLKKNKSIPLFIESLKICTSESLKENTDILSTLEKCS